MTFDQIKWKSMLILAVMAVSIWFGLNWTWGVLFLFWVFPHIREGHLVLGEDIFRDEDPILFWTSSLFLLALCLSLIVVDLIPFVEKVS